MLQEQLAGYSAPVRVCVPQEKTKEVLEQVTRWDNSVFQT